jgi:hypothetical protein
MIARRALCRGRGYCCAQLLGISEHNVRYLLIHGGPRRRAAAESKALGLTKTTALSEATERPKMIRFVAALSPKNRPYSLAPGNLGDSVRCHL